MSYFAAEVNCPVGYFVDQGTNDCQLDTKGTASRINTKNIYTIIAVLVVLLVNI